MIKTQVREVTNEVTNNVSEIDLKLAGTEPSHIHIPRPSRIAHPAVEVRDDDAEDPPQIILDQAA